MPCHTSKTGMFSLLALVFSTVLFCKLIANAHTTILPYACNMYCKCCLVLSVWIWCIPSIKKIIIIIIPKDQLKTLPSGKSGNQTWLDGNSPIVQSVDFPQVGADCGRIATHLFVIPVDWVIGPYWIPNPPGIHSPFKRFIKATIISIRHNTRSPNRGIYYMICLGLPLGTLRTCSVPSLFPEDDLRCCDSQRWGRRMIWVIYSLYMFIRGDNDIILDEDDLIGLFGDIYIYNIY